jgi:hypothetical protein
VDQRIVRALSSFISRSSDYTLARLQFAMDHPDLPSPPVLERLPDASERTLRSRWETLERQVDDVTAYVRRLEAAGAGMPREDATFAALARIIRELDQVGRALRWVLTITDRDPS